MIRIIVLAAITLFQFSVLYCQTVIWSENFNGYANCTVTGANNNTANPSNDWSTTYTDCDDAVSCTPGESFWGTFNGEFRVNDIEGGPCTCGTGGTTENFITTETIDISGFSNISVQVNSRYEGAMEAGSAGSCNNSVDIIRVTYSLDGAPFTELANNGFLTGNFVPNPATSSETCINGNTLVIQIQAGNKANGEDFYIDDIVVQGYNTMVDAGIDDTICSGQNTVLNATGGGIYNWNPSPGLSCTNCQNPSASPSSTETFVVNIDQGGCVVTDSVTIVVLNGLNQFDLGNDTVLCGGNINLLLDASQPGAISYLWQDMSTNSSFNVTVPGIYFVNVINACGNASDTISITTSGIVQVDLGEDQVLCPGNIMTFDVSDSNAISYQWQDGNTNSVYMASQPGTYIITISSPCNTVSDTLELIAPLEISNVLEDINGVCFDDSILVSLENVYEGVNFLWNTGDTTSFVYINQTGDYYVTIDYCSSEYVDSFSVNILTEEADEIYLPNAFTPNGDELNEYYQIGGLFGHTKSFRASIYNRWGELIYSSTYPGFKWNGKQNDEPLPIGVYYLQIEMIKICESPTEITVGTKINLLR